MLKRGFWADIVNGPYHSFGTTAEAPLAERLFRTRNTEHVYTAVDVAVHNVTVRGLRVFAHGGRACSMQWRTPD